MTDEKTITEEELREQVWAEFEEEFRSLGVSGVEDLDLVIRDQPPAEQEVAPDRCWLETLGTLGKYTVWVVRCAYKIATAIAVFVTLTTGLPDALTRLNINIPNTHEVVKNINDRFQRDDVLLAPGNL
jgi:hypothetical protein